MFADRLTLSLINRRQNHARHFELQESGAVWLNDKGRKIALDAWQQRKQEEITHPFIGEKIKMGLKPMCRPPCSAAICAENSTITHPFSGNKGTPK